MKSLHFCKEFFKFNLSDSRIPNQGHTQKTFHFRPQFFRISMEYNWKVENLEMEFNEKTD